MIRRLQNIHGFTRTVFKTVLLSLVFTACTGDFEELNESPTGLEESRADEDLLFTRALVYGMLRYTEFQRAQHLYAHHYIQYYSVAVDYFPTGRYITRDDWLTDYWEEAYADYAMNCQQVINLTQDEPEKINKTSIARIWKVFIMHRITDFWGDVPYFEAFQGDLMIAYDRQEDIYRDMLLELEDAVNQFDPSRTLNFSANDVMYGGSIDRWTRFANSLRLRLAMRISGVDPVLAEENVREVLADNRLIENNEQSAIMNYGRDFGGADENVQPMSLIKSFNEYRVSNTLIDYLQDNNDPRLPVYATPVNGNYVGLTNGLNPIEVNAINRNDFSQDSDIISGAYSPSAALQYAEVCFLKAEAALRGWAAGSPQEHYEDGIRASINYWLEVYDNLQGRVPDAGNVLPVIEITSADIDTFLDEPAIRYDDSNALAQIITQKWVANINNGFESWAEYRRTGFPVLNPIPNTDGLSETGGSTVPTRVRYPVEERTLNAVNYERAVQNNPDLVTTRVWWDID